MLQDTNVCMCEIKLSFAGDARLYHTRQQQQCMYKYFTYLSTYVLYFRYVTLYTYQRLFEKCLLALTTLNIPEASNSHEPSVGDKSYGVS